MPPTLNPRHRAMLQEMGLVPWWPGTPPAATPPPDARQPRQPRSQVSRTTLAPAPALLRPPCAPETLVQPRAPVQTAAPPLQGRPTDWAQLAQAVAQCARCALRAQHSPPSLCVPKTDLQQDWLILADPPDDDDAQTGTPFSGANGVLLDNMLRAVGASRTGAARAGAHVAQVLKCRPHPGRPPQADELLTCQDFLLREMALMRPKIVLALGRFAIATALQEHPQEAALPLGRQRGRVYHWRGIAVVASYHPAHLQRHQADKAKAWADLCLAADVLDGP